MIFVLSGTNRPSSRTRIVAEEVFEYLKKTYNGEVRFYSLEDLPEDLLNKGMFAKNFLHEDLKKIQEETLLHTKSWIIISPEYNGSFPGALKLFFDALSNRKYKETFSGKKAGLIGVASGRAGNLRGMDHLTGFLNYLKVTVYPDKLPVSSIEQQIENGMLKDQAKVVIHHFLDQYIEWQNC